MENFGLSALSSWLVGPLGVLYLHKIGWGNNPNLLSIILAFSTLAPLQLLLNEFIATVVIKGKYKIPRIDLLVIAIIASVGVVVSIRSARYMEFGIEIIILSLLTSLSIILSFEVSVRFFSGVMYTKISRLFSSIVGSIPGLSMLIIYVIAGLFQQDRIIFLASILPALAQGLVVVVILPQTKAFERIPSDHGPLPRTLLYGMLVSLFGIGIITSMVRSQIAAIDVQYSALILISLNLLGTVVVMISRSIYLSTDRDYLKSTGIITVILGLASLLSVSIADSLSKLLWVATLSMSVVTILAVGRRLMSTRYKVTLD